MSVLIEQGDIYGAGQTWPDGVYEADVIEAEAGREAFGGSEVYQVLGNVTTPTGETTVTNGTATFNIGARKQFVHLVTDHADEWRVQRGRRMMLQQMISAGIVARPNGKAAVEYPYDPIQDAARFASESVGTRVRFRLKTRNWKDDATGEDRSNQSINAFLPR